MIKVAVFDRPKSYDEHYRLSVLYSSPLHLGFYGSIRFLITRIEPKSLKLILFIAETKIHVSDGLRVMTGDEPAKVHG